MPWLYWFNEFLLILLLNFVCICKSLLLNSKLHSIKTVSDVSQWSNMKKVATHVKPIKGLKTN